MTQLAAPFDTDAAVIAAYHLSRQLFEEWAANDITDPPPPNAIDAMQIRLMRWQIDRFGLQTETHDLRMMAGVIEEMAETFIADEVAEDAIDGLGDAAVFGSQLATANRLAIRPIFDLAKVFTNRKESTAPLVVAGMLAQTVLKGSQKIRGLGDADRYKTRLVGAIAMCVAKSMEDLAMIHGLDADPSSVFCIVGAEVCERAVGNDAIPEPAPLQPIDPEVTARIRERRMDQALGKLHAAIDKLESVCPTCGFEVLQVPGEDAYRCSHGHAWNAQSLADHGVVVPGMDYTIKVSSIEIKSDNPDRVAQEMARGFDTSDSPAKTGE